MKIAVIGTGYVGLFSTIFLTQHNEVVVLDIISKRVALLNNFHLSKICISLNFEE